MACWSGALLVSGQNKASFADGQSAQVYSLPKTVLDIEITMEKTNCKPGDFYKYSERYLATTNVVTEEKTVFTIKDIKVKLRAVPDNSRTYTIGFGGKGGFLSVTPEGLLAGVNVPFAPKTVVKPILKTVKEEDASMPNDLLPLGEEYMMAGSTAKLAEGVAKQIYKIRESRLNILTADVDHLPADGRSLDITLKQLDKKEAYLTSLFTGKTTTETSTRTITFIPDKEASKLVAFRFSTLRGILPADDLSGNPFYINIKPSIYSAGSEDVKAKKENPGLFYVLPAETRITLFDTNTVYFDEQRQVPQFGVTLSIPEQVVNSRSKIYIDPETGRLLNIEQ